LFSVGAYFTRNINLKMGQAPVISSMKPLYDKNVANESDPKAINTYKLSLNEAKHGYKIFNDHEDAWIKRS